MVKRIIAFLVCMILACTSFLAVWQAGQKKKVPDWVLEGKPIEASRIAEKDYEYLAKWVDEHTKPAEQYLIDLFKKHQIVIFGEGHNVKEHKDFIIELIPRLYHEACVRCIGWEFSPHTDNKRLEKIVTAPEYDRELALQFARDHYGHFWNSKEHWDIIEAVWQLNQSLKQGQEKIRLVGLEKNLEFLEVFTALKTQLVGSPEWQEAMDSLIQRDEVMAIQVEKEIIEGGHKGLIFVGASHAFTHYEFPPDLNFGRPIMGNLLYKKYGDRVFDVRAGYGFIAPIIDEVLRLTGHKKVGFDLYASPFANIQACSDFDAPNVPLGRVASGYVYLGPRDKLHNNTRIVGFVTDEMFRKYKRYYEIHFGRTFKDAEDVDKYLQAHLFDRP